MSPAPWLDELLALAPRLGPGVFVAEVRHDDWCAFLNGCGPCDCNPDIEVQRIDVKDGPRCPRPEVTE